VVHAPHVVPVSVLARHQVAFEDRRVAPKALGNLIGSLLHHPIKRQTR